MDLHAIDPSAAAEFVVIVQIKKQTHVLVGFFITLAASGGNRSVTSSVRLSVRLFLNLRIGRAGIGCSTRLTRGQHAMRQTYISTRK